MPKKMARRIGKAMFDASAKGKRVNKTRPKKQAEPKSRTEKFNDMVTRAMQSGDTRVEAIAKAQEKMREKL